MGSDELDGVVVRGETDGALRCEVIAQLFGKFRQDHSGGFGFRSLGKQRVEFAP